MTDNVVAQLNSTRRSLDTITAELILERSEHHHTRTRLAVSQGIALAAIDNATELALQLGAMEAERDMALYQRDTARLAGNR